jgi:hypothetical protein
MGKAESPLGIVELRRGHAEIQQNTLQAAQFDMLTQRSEVCCLKRKSLIVFR